jgi:hypothetical protein
VIECGPCDKDDVESVACAEPLTACADPRLVAPSRNCTVPPGTGPDDGVIVAVNVTD